MTKDKRVADVEAWLRGHVTAGGCTLPPLRGPGGREVWLRLGGHGWLVEVAWVGEQEADHAGGFLWRRRRHSETAQYGPAVAPVAELIVREGWWHL